MNKCKKVFHDLQSAYRVNFNYISKCKMLHKNNSKTVVKTCENDFSNTILVAKVKVDFILMVEKSYNKQLLTSISIEVKNCIMYRESFAI